MNNKQVGIIITGFAIVLGIVIYFFNRALSQIVSTGCDHGSSCPMWGSISFHTNITLALMIIILCVGLYLVFFSDKPKKNVQKNLVKEYVFPKNLGEDETLVLKFLLEENGSLFQASLVEKTSFSKVKVTRLLDKLEGKGLIERKRRGMTNVIILKH